MNTRIRRILVAIKDPTHAPPAQLRKAATLARASGATLDLFHAIAEPEISHEVHRANGHETSGMAIESIGMHASHRLEHLAQSNLLRDVRIVTTPSWDYPPFEALIRHALRTRADLIVAAVQPERLAGRWVLANTDWELIRHSPVPVLIVKSPGDYNGAPIVAAIDPFHAHAKPSGLDKRILGASKTFARMLKGKVHAFHAYMPLVLVAPGPAGMALTLPPEIEEVHSRQVETQFARVSDRAGIPPSRRHLHMGIVKDELCAAIRDVRAGIVVMGAVSRSALRRAFIGNTAETVLDGLSCDVLVVKPAGFKTQIRLRATRRAPSHLSLV